VLCDMMLPVLQIKERLVGRRRDNHDIAALAAIASVRTAFRHKFLPPEAYAAFAAVAGFNENFGFVDELHHFLWTENLEGIDLPSHTA